MVLIDTAMGGHEPCLSAASCAVLSELAAFPIPTHFDGLFEHAKHASAPAC